MSLSAARTIPDCKGDMRVQRFRMAASTTIYAGELVMINSSGLAVPCAAAASNRGIVGVALETLTSDSSTAEYMPVGIGIFRLPGTSATQAMVGTLVYGQADSSYGATGTNLPIAGLCVEYESASLGWVAIGPQYLT